MKKLLLFLFLTGIIFTAKGQAKTDEAAIKTAILNYVDSFYQADTAKVHASVHPELAKRGCFKKDTDYRELKMSFRQMNRMASTWNKTTTVPKDAPKEITVFEIKDRIAVAKLKALWGTDYFHLVKQEGQWKIVHVVWQS